MSCEENAGSLSCAFGYTLPEAYPDDNEYVSDKPHTRYITSLA